MEFYINFGAIFFSYIAYATSNQIVAAIKKGYISSSLIKSLTPLICVYGNVSAFYLLNNMLPLKWYWCLIIHLFILAIIVPKIASIYCHFLGFKTNFEPKKNIYEYDMLLSSLLSLILIVVTFINR